MTAPVAGNTVQYHPSSDDNFAEPTTATVTAVRLSGYLDLNVNGINRQAIPYISPGDDPPRQGGYATGA